VNTVLGVVIGIIGLGFLILVHELGHFMVAKVTRMRVEEFSLGFGPYLVKKRWGETVYGISAVPLGGYVRVTGMHKEEFEERVAELREIETEEAAEQSESVDLGKKKRRVSDPEDTLAGRRALTAEEIAATPLEKRYYSHPLWHKLLFIVAGVLMNAIVAFVLLYVVGLVDGENIATAVVESVTPGSGAAQAGVRPGDRIVGIDGEEVPDWDTLRWLVIKHKGDSVSIVVERDGSIIPLAEKATIGQDKEGLGLLGVSWGGDIIARRLGLGGSFGYAARQFASVVEYTVDGIGMMFTRDVPVIGSSGVAGVIGIVQISGEMVSRGATAYLYFVALISVNLALLNMLPLLPLDGGHFVYAIVEKLRRRPVSLKVFERISMAGFALIAVLFVVALYNDIGRLFTGLPR
jgi:regulator of sigma E protease